MPRSTRGRDVLGLPKSSRAGTQHGSRLTAHGSRPRMRAPSARAEVAAVNPKRGFAVLVVVLAACVLMMSAQAPARGGRGTVLRSWILTGSGPSDGRGRGGLAKRVRRDRPHRGAVHGADGERAAASRARGEPARALRSARPRDGGGRGAAAGGRRLRASEGRRQRPPAPGRAPLGDVQRDRRSGLGRRASCPARRSRFRAVSSAGSSPSDTASRARSSSSTPRRPRERGSRGPASSASCAATGAAGCC